MATLTETAYYTRAAIKYGTLFIVFLIIARILFGVGHTIFRKIFPPPPPPPTVLFGKLPALPFPEQKSDKRYSFSLQTPTGELPKLPTAANVYFMPEAQTSFLNLEDARTTARSLGFAGEPQAINETIYRFEHPNAPASIDMNIINKTFSLNYNLAATPELINLRPKSTDEALRAVRNLLSGADLLTPDLEAGKRTFDFIKVEPPKLVSALSLSEASFVRVNLFRQEYDSLPTLTPSPNRANVWFLVSGDTSRGKQIIAGEFHYFPVDSSRSSTYPIKTSQQAWDELVSGDAYVASPLSGEGSNVTIRRVYLANYDSGKPQKFLQPVIVFEGDDDFMAYIPAITAEYYSQE